MLVRERASATIAEQMQSRKVAAEALRFLVRGAVTTTVIVDAGDSTQGVSEYFPFPELRETGILNDDVAAVTSSMANEVSTKR